MFNLRKPDSKLYDQNTFDDQFMRDLQKARKALSSKARSLESPELKNSLQYSTGSKSVAWQYYLTPNHLKNTTKYTNYKPKSL